MDKNINQLSSDKKELTEYLKYKTNPRNTNTLNTFYNYYDSKINPIPLNTMKIGKISGESLIGHYKILEGQFLILDDWELSIISNSSSDKNMTYKLIFTYDKKAIITYIFNIISISDNNIFILITNMQINMDIVSISNILTYSDINNILQLLSILGFNVDKYLNITIPTSSSLLTNYSIKDSRYNTIFQFKPHININKTNSNYIFNASVI